MTSALRKLAFKKAAGPDRIKNEMIVHLGSTAKTILLRFINRTWRESQLPSAWRTARISPVLKKGKPAGDPQSYRPISLTSCIGKLAERMVNSRLYWWLENNRLLQNTQAGFRKGSRTEDQLFRFVQNTIDGFQDGKSTVAIFVDLQQAYDRVWRRGLLIKMMNMGIHGKMLDWVSAFLSNRTIQTTVDGTTSSKKTLEEGLPQGSALSCTLFLVFINDLPPLKDISRALFADDLVIWTTNKYPVLARAKLNEALRNISFYCNLWKLKLNQQKTVYSIFTRSPKTGKCEMQLKIDGTPISKADNPAYLGVELDRQLFMTTFIKNMKEKATKRLNLIKHLASTSWGADKMTLRQLYLGYVRSVMEYALPLQTIASKSVSGTLEKVQNQALRLVCGGMRSTPTAACEIDANVEPMDLRRERALLESVERYRRLQDSHPNRRLVDKWERNQRLQQKSPMEIATTLEKEHHLPQQREPLRKCSGIPPWENIKTPSIKTSLLDPTVNKETLPTILKTSAMETIDSYPASWIHIYTDGSAFKGTTYAGYGVLLKYPDGTSYEFSDACGSTCSNYEAETIAVMTAVEIAHQQFDLGEKAPTNIVIFSDSRSALQALENPGNSHSDIEKLSKTISNLLTSYDIQLTLQWVPGHTDIHGNEVADRLAKQGTKKNQPSKACSIDTVKQILRNNSKEEWLNRWNSGFTGRVMYKQMSHPKPNDKINTLKREEQSLIFQLRTGHSKLNYHLNRINALKSAKCRNCPYPCETVEHVLFECPKLQQIRQRLLPPHPSVENTLYGPSAQLRNTCKFIKAVIDS